MMLSYQDVHEGHYSITAYLLSFIILIEGFVSIASEILAIRQLLPFAGGSVIVTSLIIGIFLLFLALGYHQGGKSNLNSIALLQKNFLMSAIWLGAGLSYIFISLFFIYFHKIFSAHIIYPLITYLLLVIAPLIFFLGQTLPITMNLLKQNKQTGVIGGYALSLSTLGSFLGSILTSLVMLHFFGVAYTVFFNAALLLLASLLLKKKKSLIQLILYFSTLLLIFIINIDTEKSLFILTNNYANYQIISSTLRALDKEKIFFINGTFSSRLNQKNEGFPYIETIKKILFNDLRLRGKDILVLGAGGFTLSAQNTFSNRFTYVDIDSQIKLAAIPKFIDKLNQQFIADDARHYLRISQQLYSAIIVDVYTDYKAIPAHLTTIEYMQAIKKHLTPQGTAILNIVANPMLTDPYSKHLDNTIRAVFKNCMVIPQKYGNQASNIIYLCNKAGLKDNIIYTDDLNKSTTDSFNW